MSIDDYIELKKSDCKMVVSKNKFGEYLLVFHPPLPLNPNEKLFQIRIPNFHELLDTIQQYATNYPEYK